MLVCSSAPIPIPLGNYQMTQPVSFGGTCTDTNSEYYGALDQWLERSEKDDAVYAQACAAGTFKPFEDSDAGLSSSITSNSTSSSSDTSSAEASSPKNTFDVMHVEGFTQAASLPPPPSKYGNTKLMSNSKSSTRKSAPRLSLPTAPKTPLSQHTPKMDEHGRLVPYEETPRERCERECFMKEREYARRLALAGLKPIVGGLEEGEWERLGRAGESEENVVVSSFFLYKHFNLLTLSQEHLPIRRRHLRARLRPTPAQRHAAARTIQRAYRRHVQRESVVATIVEDIEGVTYDVRDAFLQEIESSQIRVCPHVFFSPGYALMPSLNASQLPSPSDLLLYNAALTALALRLSLYLSSLPTHIAHSHSVTEARETVEGLVGNERKRAERLGVSSWVWAQRRKMVRKWDLWDQGEILREEEEEN